MPDVSWIRPIPTEIPPAGGRRVLLIRSRCRAPDCRSRQYPSYTGPCRTLPHRWAGTARRSPALPESQVGIAHPTKVRLQTADRSDSRQVSSTRSRPYRHAGGPTRSGLLTHSMIRDCTKRRLSQSHRSPIAARAGSARTPPTSAEPHGNQAAAATPRGASGSWALDRVLPLNFAATRRAGADASTWPWYFRNTPGPGRPARRGLVGCLGVSRPRCGQPRRRRPGPESGGA